jgi:hypothetical protein
MGVLPRERGSTSYNYEFDSLVFLRSVRRLPVTSSVVPSSQIPVTLMEGAIISSEKSVLK